MRRRLAAALALGGVIGLVLWPAGAGAHASERDGEDRISLSGEVHVAADETAANAVTIFDGDLVVDGRVTGAAVTFAGDIVVRGRVDEDVVSLFGHVTIVDGARVGGDVVAPEDELEVSPGAVVGGTTVSSHSIDAGVGLVLLSALLILAGIWIGTLLIGFLAGLLLALLAPRALEAAWRALDGATGTTIGIGLTLAIGLPVITVVAMVAVNPVGLVLLVLLALLWAVAFGASSYLLGRSVLSEDQSPALMFLAGWGILAVSSLVPILGQIAWAGAIIAGLGSLAVAAARGGGD